MRVSDATQIDAVLSSLASVEGQLTSKSQVASTGSKINAPSDDPVAAAQLVRIQASVAQTSSYQKTITTVQGDLTLTESSLANAGDVMSSALELAIQAGDGALSASDRQQMASQIGQLQSQLLDIANTKGATGYLFSGSQVNTAAFSAGGVYQGDSVDRVAQIGAGNTATVNVTGANAFTAAGGVDVFGALSALQTAMTNNDMSGIGAGVNALNQAASQISAARSDAGIKLDRLTTAASAHTQTQLSLASAQQGLAAADPAQAYSQLVAAQTAVQEAIDTSRLTLSTVSAQNLFG